MENRIVELDLLNYRGIKSTVYTGRPQGEEARRKMGLDKLDRENDCVSFLIPIDTTTITPSFFLGLLYDSIKKLTFEKYKSKYLFNFGKMNPDRIEILKKDIQEGERNAINSIKGD